MIVLNANESRELDRLSQTVYGIPSYTLMQRAGEAVAAAVMREFSEETRNGVLVVAGKGNNGGDGLVAARKLIEWGITTRVVLLTTGLAYKGDAARAYADLSEANVAAGLATFEETLDAESAESVLSKRAYGVVIDAIFGTGLNAQVKGLAGAAISAMNAAGRPIVAVDIPSGLDADTGAIMDQVRSFVIPGGRTDRRT
jgi:ADP-dependent NAD(P)H-hydrate dehydratase / NAD(P)H-hydrate epimerase